ncbi:MAG: TIGR04086 family membrane protein [Bacillota bacterium]|nr:TIGR04086 family membrane protein [Bacillota bacterium]
MSDRVSLRTLFKGAICTLVAMVVIVVIFSGIFYLFPLKTNTLTIFGNIAIALSLFCGGCITARSCRKNTLLHGVALALIFFVVLLALTFLWGEPKLWVLIQKTALIFVGSLLGSIVGVD